MNPTPEQLAFAFTMMALRRDPLDAAEPSSRTVNGLMRIAAILLIGVSATLLGLSYIDGRTPDGARFEADGYMSESAHRAFVTRSSDTGDDAAYAESASTD